MEQLSLKTILLVDDNHQVRSIMARALTDAGYQVVEAEDGASALNALATRAHIHLLVTDIVMPGLTGFELASHVIAAHNVPVLFISAYGVSGKDIPGPVLRKPFTTAALLHTVQRLLAITDPSMKEPV